MIKIPFILEEEIELSNFIKEASSPKEYKLIGIVSISLRERKYIAFSKSPVDKNWYLYDDSKAFKVNIDFVLQSHNNLNFYCPYILFYES